MTRNQQWARRALERILDAKNRDSKDDYKALAMKLPALLQQSGLSQGLVFVASRGDVGVRLLDDLACVCGAVSGAELRSRAQSVELPQYLALTRDLIECAVWLRRFTQIELGS
jgi:CRISPR-associated protein Cmr5